MLKEVDVDVASKKHVGRFKKSGGEDKDVLDGGERQTRAQSYEGLLYFLLLCYSYSYLVRTTQSPEVRLPGFPPNVHIMPMPLSLPFPVPIAPRSIVC